MTSSRYLATACSMYKDCSTSIRCRNFLLYRVSQKNNSQNADESNNDTNDKCYGAKFSHGHDLGAVVSESRFFNLETRMRVSPIQSRSSRRDREFLTLTLRLRDETEKKFPPISGIETRSRFIIFTLRLRDENENSLDLISFFETRPRILKLAIFP